MSSPRCHPDERLQPLCDRRSWAGQFCAAAAVVAALALIALTAAPAQACACAPPKTVAVAAGRSPAGERWRVGASRHGRYVGFETTVVGQPDAGAFLDVGARRLRGGCRALIGTADYVSGWQEIAGPVDRSVHRLEIPLADGRKVSVAPPLLRTSSRHAHAWLRGFRWASVF